MLTKLKLSLKQKRFLIVWIIFHSLALFVNKAEIEGLTDPSLPYQGSTGYQVYLFTNINNEAGFWPFVSFVKTTNDNEGGDHYGPIVWFNGLFYEYSTSAYLFYILLGCGIVVIPQLWGKNNEADLNS